MNAQATNYQRFSVFYAHRTSRAGNKNFGSSISVRIDELTTDTSSDNRTIVRRGQIFLVNLKYVEGKRVEHSRQKNALKLDDLTLIIGWNVNG